MKSGRLYGYFWAAGKKNILGNHVFKTRSTAIYHNVVDLLDAELLPYRAIFSKWTKEYIVTIPFPPKNPGDRYLGIGFLTSIIECYGDGDGTLFSSRSLSRVEALQTKFEELNIGTQIWSSPVSHRLMLDKSESVKLKSWPFVTHTQTP